MKGRTRVWEHHVRRSESAEKVRKMRTLPTKIDHMPQISYTQQINCQMFKIYAITVIHAKVRILRTRESLQYLFTGLARERSSSKHELDRLWRTPLAHSERRLRTGLATAARIACTHTVNSAIATAPKPAAPNTHQWIAVRYS